MKVKQLIRRLKKQDPEAEVFFKRSNGIGNISHVDYVFNDTYGFFGVSVPCVMMDDRPKKKE